MQIFHAAPKQILVVFAAHNRLIDTGQEVFQCRQAILMETYLSLPKTQVSTGYLHSALDIRLAAFRLQIISLPHFKVAILDVARSLRILRFAAPQRHQH
jgi:hypothetical protein